MAVHLSQEPPLTFYSAYVHSASLYLQYLSVFRSLEDCYDQLIHPQKRQDIRLTLELCMARLVQLRHDLLLYSSSQPSALSTPSHPHLEPFLAPLHLSPSSLEVPIPRYFQERSDVEDERKKRDLVDKLSEENAVMWGTAGQDPGLVSEEVQQRLAQMNRLTREHAIKLIQKNERGRQGAMRAALMKELREEDARKRLRDAGRTPTRDDAASVIQRVWRGYVTRKSVKEEAVEELVFLGMKPSITASNQQTIAQPSPTALPALASPTSSASILPRYDPLVKEQQIRIQRKTRQMDAALHYQDRLRGLEVEIEAHEGEDMKQKMWDERYSWWVEEKEKTGKYPLDLSLFYVTRYPDSDEAKAAQAADTKKGKSKGGKKEPKAEEPKAKAKEEKPKEGKGKAPPEVKAVAPGLTLGPTPLVPQLSACVRRYAEVWLGRDEGDNPDQGFDVEMAKAGLRPLVEKRVRKGVDERMGLYLENIREKVAEVGGGKGGKKGKAKAKAKPATPNPPTEPPPAKVEEGKEQMDLPVTAEAETGTSRESKAGKGEKAKAVKPGKKCCEGDKLCSHLSLQDMTALLIKMNILQQLATTPLTLPVTAASAPPANSLRLAALQGEANLVGQLTASALASSPEGGHVDPSYQQLRAFFTERFILPLGSAFVHSTQPSPLRSLLLFGPAGSGKTLTAKCIAKESGALWFDLSTKNLERKLGTKAEIAKLVHLIFTVAREVQPAVLYLDDCDKVWGSGKSKRGASELAKLRALVMQHAMGLERGDRVLLIGCCRCPHSDRVEVKELLDLFGPPQGAVVLMPLPDLITRRQLWGYFIQQSGLTLATCEKSQGFDLQTLALVSEGYTAGDIQQAVLSTLPSKRVQALMQLDKGIDTTDFITALSQTSYTYRGEYAANVAWLEQVTGVKDRRRMREVAEAKEAAPEEGEVKAKKK